MHLERARRGSFKIAVVPSSRSHQIYKQSISRLKAIALPIPASFQADLEQMAKDLEAYQSHDLSTPRLPVNDLEEVARLNAEKIERARHYLRTAEEQVNSLSSRVILYNWLFAILATAAEVYLEHALLELLSATLSIKLLPEEVIDGIKKTWIKTLLRNKPGAWLTALRKMGTDTFPDNLGSEMHTLWEKRHQTVHSEQSLKANLEEFEQALKIVDIFVDTTDAFIVKKLAEANQTNLALGQNA